MYLIWRMSYYFKPEFTVALTTQCLTNLGCLLWFLAYYSMSTRCLSSTSCWRGYQNTGHQSNPRTGWYSMSASGDIRPVLYSHSILTQINTRLVVHCNSIHRACDDCNTYIMSIWKPTNFVHILLCLKYIAS